MDPKSIFASRTMWFNALVIAAQIIPGVAGMIPQPWGELATALGNIALRYVTTQPLKVP